MTVELKSIVSLTVALTVTLALSVNVEYTCL